MAIPSWLQLSAVSGSGDTQITITASTSQEIYERAYSLLISGHTKTVTIPVTQEPSENTLSVYPSSHVFAYTGGTFQYTVTSNSNWTITSHPNWLTFDVLSGTTGTSSVNVTAGTNYDTQKEADIVFSAVTTTASTHVTQDAFVVELEVSPSAYTYDYTGGTVMVTITSNCDWEIQDTPSWITVSQMSGTTGTTVIYVEADESSLLYQRTGDVVVYHNTTSASMHITQEAAPDPALNEFLTFNITSPGNIVWKTDNASWSKTIYYRKNSGQWTSISATTAGTSFSVTTGDVIEFKGDNSTYGRSTGFSRNTFSGSTAEFSVSGNIMSLINSTSFGDLKTLTTEYTFMGLFSYTHITSSNDLLLPATTLSSHCYDDMFHHCEDMTSTPELVATTLASGCYGRMFWYCKSLTTAPELPATTLAPYCYDEMFLGCTSLTTAPELPVTTLAGYCYLSMFQGCTSLTTAPELPASTMTVCCYRGMFYGCTSLTSAPELPATTLAEECYEEMFNGCTSLTTAPVLQATTLASSCYDSMFYGCTSLTTAPELPATTLVSSCYAYMFNRCTNLNYVKCLATDISANSCLTYWLYNVASTGTFVKAPSMQSWPRGTSGIPNNWTVVNAT